MAKAGRIIRQFWEVAREVLGDKAYERYEAHARLQGEKPVAPTEFYLAELQRKYSKPSRCC